MNVDTGAVGTMRLAEKGPIAAVPSLEEPLVSVAAAIGSWPGVNLAGHWSPFNSRLVDGVDFYLDDLEIGHIHLDGSIHIATSPLLGKQLIDEGRARPFHYVHGWTCEMVQNVGSDAAIALFRANYERLAVLESRVAGGFEMEADRSPRSAARR